MNNSHGMYTTYTTPRFLLVCLMVLGLSFITVAPPSVAQETETVSSEETGTSTSTSTDDEVISVGITERLTPIIATDKKDTTQPEELGEKVAILTLLESRNVDRPSIFNFFAYWVQQAIALGVPANTIVLILLTPVLATILVFTRVMIGLRSLELLVPIALSFAFVAVGVTVGLIILGSVLLASYVSRVLLKRLTIMVLPKRALSMTLLALFVFAALTVTAAFDLAPVANLSIFPILILTLLGDSIVSVQLHKTLRETVNVTVVTILLGVFGYLLATSQGIFNLIILYPEVILLSIPANVLLGRYFGLRLTEYFRFERID